MKLRGQRSELYAVNRLAPLASSSIALHQGPHHQSPSCTKGAGASTPASQSTALHQRRGRLHFSDIGPGLHACSTASCQSCQGQGTWLVSLPVTRGGQAQAPSVASCQGGTSVSLPVKENMWGACPSAYSERLGVTFCACLAGQLHSLHERLATQTPERPALRSVGKGRRPASREKPMCTTLTTWAPPASRASRAASAERRPRRLACRARDT